MGDVQTYRSSSRTVWRVTARLLLAALTVFMGCSSLPKAASESVVACRLPVTPGEGLALLIGTMDGENEFQSMDLFRQVFQTLVMTDCNDRVVPDFALSWEPLVGGGFRFALPEASYSDGTPANATALTAAWNQAGGLPPGVDSVHVRGPLELDVYGATLHDLTAPPFAVWNGDEDHPTGTGRFTVTRRAEGGSPLELSGGGMTIQVLDRGDGRARDLVTRVHLLRAWDLGVLGLAVDVPGLVLRPIDWSRSYGLLVPGGSGVALLPGSLLSDLSQQAVPARSKPLVCTVDEEHALSDFEASSLFGDPRDPVSVALAERLVAISRQEAGDGERLRSTAGVSEMRLVHSGGDQSPSIRTRPTRAACESRPDGLWIPLVQVQTSLLIDRLPVPGFVDGDGYLVIEPGTAEGSP